METRNATSELNPIQLVILQPTPFCNIDCRYCYLPDRLSTKRISAEVLANFSRFLFSCPLTPESITIVWHAGEPMVLPVSFYKEAFSTIAKFNTKKAAVTHSFQTNGTLINQEWCDFIKENQIEMGVSLDGPEHIHNASRVDRFGKGTFSRTLQGIRLLKKNNIPFSTITVLTKHSLDYPDEIWNFFMEQGITRLAFNIEEIEGINTVSTLQGNEVNQYKAFFNRILDLKSNSTEKIFVRELDYKIRKVLSKGFVRHTENIPFTVLSVDCEGNISPFSPELLSARHPLYGNFIFGNVAHSTVESILSSQKFIQINSDIQAGVEMCRNTCDYFIVCGGGPPVNKLYENGTFKSTETMACKFRIKAITDIVVEHLEKQYQIE